MNFSKFSYFYILGIVVIVGLVAFFLWLQDKRSLKLIHEWAARENLKIISVEYRIVRLGPFFRDINKGTTIWHVEVEDTNGQRKKGYLKCGRYSIFLNRFSFINLFVDKDVEVIWED